MFTCPASFGIDYYYSPAFYPGYGKTGELDNGERFEVIAHKPDMMVVRMDNGDRVLLECLIDGDGLDAWTGHPLVNDSYAGMRASFWTCY